MDLSRVTRNDWVIIVGAVLMFIGTLGAWYSVSVKDVLGFDVDLGVDTSVNGWHGSYFGWLTFLLCLAAALAVLARAFAGITLPASVGLIALGAGVLSVLIVLIRMVAQPGPNEIVGLGWGIWLSFIAAVLVAVGGLMKTAEPAS